MARNDFFSRKYTVDLMNNSGETLGCLFFSGRTFDYENGNVDIMCCSISGEELIERKVELKVQNKDFDNIWTTDTTAITFYNVPNRTDTYNTFTNEFCDERAESVPNCVIGNENTTIPDNFVGKQFFIFNADRNGDGHFLVQTGATKYHNKWLKMHEEKQDLMVIYKDGILFVPYHSIRNNFIGYCRYFERDRQSSQAIYGRKDIRYRWGIKACVEIPVKELKEKKEVDGIRWFPLTNIPENVFGNNR